MARFKDWPAGTHEAYQEIVARHKVLQGAIVTAQEGNKEKNEELLRRLMKLIHSRARRTQEYCQEITGYLPKDAKGRNPKWYTVTLDIQANAMAISDIVKDINIALKRTEFDYIDTLLLCMQKKIEAIGKLLEAHPHEGLSVWEETVNEALYDFD